MIRNNPRLKYWPIIFLAFFIEGIITVVWLGLIPPDAKSNVWLVFSLKRLLMMAFVIGVMIVSALGGWFAWRRPDWRKKWLSPERRPGFFHWVAISLLVIAFGLESALLFLRNYDPAWLTPLYIRSMPILGYLFLICAQSVIWLQVLRHGHGLKLLWSQSIFWILGWTSISLLVYWAFSPAGGGELHTWWYIRTFDPLRYERHGEDYCSSDYSSSVASQYLKAQDIRLQLANIDRPKALLAIFNQVTKGAKTNTEKQLMVLDFIQKASIQTTDIASFSPGDWVYDPLVLLELGNMYCTQGAILAIDLFGAAGYPGRLVQLAHHQIAEIYYDGDWHYLDTDLFGNGESVLDNKGYIPSVAEMSKGDYQKLDALPAFQEFNVMDCSSPVPNGDQYASYYYFSSQAYLTDVPQNYFVGLDSAYDFEHGWIAVEKITPNDKVVLYDFPVQLTPTKPNITNVLLYNSNTTLAISFKSTDPNGDLAGIQIFISDRSRGWDYNQFYGNKSAKVYWANPRGWKPTMYGYLFELPPSNLGLINLTGDKKQVNIPVHHGMTYFITVMPIDSYGLSVSRVLYPESNELKVIVP
jgi:hypothetical protein